MNVGRHTTTAVYSKNIIDFRKLSPSLHSHLPWIVSDSPHDSDHCVITKNVQTRSSKPQSSFMHEVHSKQNRLENF